MLSVNDKVVYPGYGVAQIIRVIEKRVGEHPTCFFELHFLNRDMTILVPTDKLISVGIRPLSSQNSINNMLKMLAQDRYERMKAAKISNWNKRSKDYQSRLRSGDILEISKIYRDLKCIARSKELSFGEKNLLQQTENLLVEEISIVKGQGEDKAIEELRSLF